MSLKLGDRDYVPDGNGGVASGRGGEELLDEALFRLAARRGSFPFLPELGQLGGDAALPHAENFLKFRDAQGFFIQNVDNAQAGGICQEFERF